MINFHKKTGRPVSVQKGHEDVWFSTTGLYASANDGSARLITAATLTGNSVPVGVPVEPNMLYFNKTTRKHYISTDQKWIEIPTAGIPGSGTGGGNASNVMIADAGNWYTSNDVEGALAEVGERLPHLLGTGLLPNYGANTYDIKTGSEYLLNTTATNKPSSVASWMISRKSSTGDMYGLAVDKNGQVFSRVNNSFTQLARNADLDSANNAISALNSSLAANWKVKDIAAGLFTTAAADANGVYTVGLNTEARNLLNGVKNGNYVKKAGDTMTGSLTVRSATGTGIVYVRDATDTNHAGLRAGDDGAGLYDYKRGRNIIANYNSGSTYLFGYGKTTSVFRVEHKLNFETSRTDALGYAFEMHARGVNHVLYAQGKNSRHLFGGNNRGAYIATAGPTGAKANLTFEHLGGGILPAVKFETTVLHSTTRITTGSGVHIGSNETGSGGIAGEERSGAKLHLFPYSHNGSKDQRRRYASIGFDARQDLVTIDTADRRWDLPAGYANGKQARVAAGAFIVRSSETVKDVHGEFTENVLETVKKVKPYIYNYKGSPEKPELGFIVERGVPTLLQEGKGDDRGLNSYSLVAYLWKAVQELTEKVEKLEEQVKR